MKGHQGNFATTRPRQVLVRNASRSRSSRCRSKAVRYLSYESLKDRSTFEEKMSSPRGLVLGGIVGIGMEEVLRLGIGEWAGDGGLGGGGVGFVKEKGLRERRGG